MASQIASLLFKKQVETFHGKLRRPEESDDILSHNKAQIIREVILITIVLNVIFYYLFL